MKNWIVNVVTIGMVLCLVFTVGIVVVKEQSKRFTSFCSDKNGIQEVEVCDYHLPFIGDVGCYISSVDCGE